ncbi:hypothetical protein [Fodinicola acaciae]|uniref:hypothetical protein n=1 Tax=Fodinicola acaciae TaxID=2681555 RepID=UPI0013D474F9|nr:hypothetical protein [Fodinicola acaciae]
MEEITQPGTIDDLVADAAAAGYSVRSRSIRDWSERGLLDYPAKRSAGQGRGSRPALYPARQRMLLLTLLHHRRTGQRIRSLARIPVGLWLYWGEEYVPLSQARRAFMTWLGDSKVNLDIATTIGKQLINQMSHPDATRQARDHLLEVLTNVGYTGRLPDVPDPYQHIDDALRAVFEPELRQLRRAIGHPDAPFTTDAIVGIVRARTNATARLNAGEVTDAEFRQARTTHLMHHADYARRQPVLAASVDPASNLYEKADMETALNHCCSDLLTVLGFPAPRTKPSDESRPPT